MMFFIGNILYVGWILLFMKYRCELDVKRFEQSANEESNLIQMVSAMQEIKLNNCETQKRWQWERIQVKLFKISVKGLALGQVQQVGAVFLNQTTNIIISFIAAKAVCGGADDFGYDDVAYLYYWAIECSCFFFYALHSNFRMPR